MDVGLFAEAAWRDGLVAANAVGSPLDRPFALK